MIVMASATVMHTFRGQTESAVTTAILFMIVTAVAYLRWKVVPIAVRKRHQVPFARRKTTALEGKPDSSANDGRAGGNGGKHIDLFPSTWHEDVQEDRSCILQLPDP